MAAVPRDPAAALLLAVVACGVLLRLAAYAANRSLFIDEAALALSIRDRALPELLTRPLDYAQTAPPGFLLLLEVATQALGESEYTLRLPVLLVGVLSVPLFAVLARHLLPTSGAIVATALFAFGRPLIYFSGEAKPYAFDVLAALAVLLLARRLWAGEVTSRRAWALGTGGAAAVWFSQPALFVLAGVGLAFVATGRCNRRTAGVLLPRVVLPWMASGLLVVLYTFSVYTPEARAYMKAYWADGFLPLPPRAPEDWLWLVRTLLTFCLDPLGSPLPLLPLAALVTGAFWTARRDRALLGLAAAPLLVTLLASAFGLYPFGRMDFAAAAYSGRVVLFLVPAALLLVGAGFGAWWAGSRGTGRLAAYLAALVLVGTSAAQAVATFPYTREDGRAPFAYLARNRAPGEPVYVYFRGQHYARFYAPRFGLDPDDFTVGTCLHEPPRSYLSELDELRRRGTSWVVVIPSSVQEPRMLLDFLRRNGVEVEGALAQRSRVSRFDLRANGEPVLPPDSLLVPRQDPRVRRLACATIYRAPR